MVRWWLWHFNFGFLPDSPPRLIIFTIPGQYPICQFSYLHLHNNALLMDFTHAWWLHFSMNLTSFLTTLKWYSSQYDSEKWSSSIRKVTSDRTHLSQFPRLRTNATQMAFSLPMMILMWEGWQSQNQKTNHLRLKENQGETVTSHVGHLGPSF